MRMSNDEYKEELGDDWSDIDEEWDNYLENNELYESQHKEDEEGSNDITKETDMYQTLVDNPSKSSDVPTPSPLIISTKSQETQLEIPVDLDIFWKIPVIPYDERRTGVIKKQTLIKVKNIDEYDEYNVKIKRGILTPGCNYMKQRIINHTDIQIVEKRKFYHKSVIAYGICSKDFHKNKNTAFRNSFCLKIRLCLPDDDAKDKQPKYHEYNVNIFNTGRITFQGVKHYCILKELFARVVDILKMYSVNGEFEHCSANLDDHKQVKILVNSNFKCGFCINQLKLRQIIATKYRSECIYNAGNQYTGLRSKYYYDTLKTPEEQTGMYMCDPNADASLKNEMVAAAASAANNNKPSKNRTSKMVPLPNHIMRVSYAVFRTGSVLVAGKCDDHILNAAYRYIADILANEFKYIYMGEPEIKIKKVAKKKKYTKMCVLGETATIH
jgi:hypothetical protein